MKFNNTCKIPIFLTSEPYERPWETVDKTSGNKKTGVASVIRGIMIPENKEADPSTLKEIEFNISNIANVGQSPAQVMKTYLKNEDNFKDGKSYAMVETYMGPRLNRDGLVTFFSPYVNNIEVVETTEEDKPLIKVVTDRNEQL